jgi:hypothetical protein
MKIWTKQAELRLQEYLDARVRKEGLIGSDARELREDLSSHVHEEAESLGAAQISSAEIETIVRGLEKGLETRAETPAVRTKGWRWAMFFGAVLPLVIALFEILTGFCGGVFFDPVPTVWHGILVLSVPVLNGWLLTKGFGASPMLRGAAAGWAIAVSLFYALLFLPLLPLSVLALIAMGMGLLSLSPIFAAWASWRIMRRSRDGVVMPWVFKRGLRFGIAGATLALLILEAPSSWTRYQLARALSEDAEISSAGLDRLRAYHSGRTLLRACYEGNRGMSMATDISGWFGKGWRIPLSMVGGDVWRDADSEKTREVFFRATGKPFNSMKPPRMVRESAFSMGRGMGFNDLEFDDHLGGDQVAVRVRDLDLAESRFDGHVDSVSRTGYGEWTMVFKNTGREAKEARCQVRLPRGGKVSRLTLWVNGEPREAAFNSVEKVKAAYRSVAVVQRLDPVLVTMAGPDTVMVQCFPVPAGGEMKIRFGVTAPLDGRRWELPRVIERNFGISQGAEHSLWLQADNAFEISGGDGVPGSAKDGEGFSTNAITDLNESLEKPMALRLGGLSETRESVWCVDPFAAPSERFLQRIPTVAARKAVDKLVVVIDGSSSMAGEAALIAWVLTERYGKGGMEIIIADDGALLADPEMLRRYRFSGGRDNQAALWKAVSIAKEGENGAVVWLHGPQAVELAKSESLLQLLERGTNRPVIHDVEMVSGSNRLSDKLGNAGVLRRGPTLFNHGTELGAFLDELREGGASDAWEWQRHGDGVEMQGKKVWDHLARIWAMEYSESTEADRGKVAAKYQLVTPVSGAVVLETMQQFKDHGLVPVDASAAPSIPGVPEPSTGILVMLAASAALMRRRRVAPGNDAAVYH